MKKSLLEKITNEVSKKLGFNKAKELVNKTLLDKSGRIKVIQRDDSSGEENFSVTLIKSVLKKTVDIRVFSPLDDTGFSLTTACTNPKVDFGNNTLIAEV